MSKGKEKIFWFFDGEKPKVHKVYVWIIWLTLLVAVLSNVTVPNGMEIIIGDMNPPMYLQYFVRFLGITILWFLAALYMAWHTNTIMAWMLVWLSIGKMCDLFVAPYGYGIVQVCWDILGVVVAVCWWLYRSQKK